MLIFGYKHFFFLLLLILLLLLLHKFHIQHAPRFYLSLSPPFHLLHAHTYTPFHSSSTTLYCYTRVECLVYAIHRQIFHPFPFPFPPMRVIVWLAILSFSFCTTTFVFMSLTSSFALFVLKPFQHHPFTITTTSIFHDDSFFLSSFLLVTCASRGQ